METDAVEVRLFATLPRHSRRGAARFTCVASPDLTVRDVLREEGIDERLVHIILLNGKRVTLDAALNAGDQLGVFPPVGGG